jgi:ubiquinone/menaquinone biosynthesis C-methylase UbiE
MLNRTKALVKRVLQKPADALLTSSSVVEKITRRKIGDELHVSGKFLPYCAEQNFYLLLNAKDAERGVNGLPLPPQDLWEGYGATVNEFLDSGKFDNNKMNDILKHSNFRIQQGYRVLDFGCAAGRMTRWLHDIADSCEIWGVDISARHITWCQENFSPPFKFATITTAPHLPFEDRYFHLIYCGSVFTHIDDLADAWLLELRRVLRPGGRIYITVHDKHTVHLIMNMSDKSHFMVQLLSTFEQNQNFSKLDYYKFTIGRGASSQVFYDVDYLRRHWGSMLTILSVTPEAYGYQTAILLEK